MTYATDRQTVAELQAQFLAKGNEIQRCPTHATSTGNIRHYHQRKSYATTHDYVVWAISADGRQFSERVEKVADVNAAEEAFMALYEDARITQIHEVR
jgi:hypothetical protein